MGGSIYPGIGVTGLFGVESLMGGKSLVSYKATTSAITRIAMVTVEEATEMATRFIACLTGIWAPCSTPRKSPNEAPLEPGRSQVALPPALLRRLARCLAPVHSRMV